jgi:hypothetical protein
MFACLWADLFWAGLSMFPNFLSNNARSTLARVSAQLSVRLRWKDLPVPFGVLGHHDLREVPLILRE